jgi:hypothetical protein
MKPANNENKKYRGLYDHRFIIVEATSYEDAQKKMSEILIKQIQEDDEPFVVYEMDAEDEAKC